VNDVQDTHRQKHWADEQKEAASKEASDRQQGGQSQQVPDNHSQVQPAKGKQENTGRRSANGLSSDSLAERGRILKHDAQALTGSVRESAEIFQRYVSEQVEQRPYTTVAIAAGVGYVLGGGLATRITAATFGAVYRIGLALAARELSSRIAMSGVGEDSSRQQRPER